MSDTPTAQATKPVTISPTLVKMAGWSWRMLVIALFVGLVVWVVYHLRVVTVPIFLALLATTVLLPPANFLRRRGLSAALSTTIVFLVATALVVGLIAVLASPVSTEFGRLGPQVREALDDINNWLSTGPLNLDQSQLDDYRNQLVQQLSANSSSLQTGVLSSATLAIEIFTGILLSIVLTFFFVKDGGIIVRAIVERFPRRRQDLVARAGTKAFHTLGGYLRGVAATGIIDSVFISIGLLVIGVPLVLPLAVLTFFGAFFPVVGATVAGALAAAVALVNGGVTDALLVIAVVLIVQQVEGHILQPLLVGRAVSLHPVVILVALGSGAVLAGLLGAFLAVPLTAMAGSILREIDAQAADEVAVGSAPGSSAPGG